MQTWRWFYVVLIGVTVALLSMVVNLGIAGLNSLKIKTTERFISGPGAPYLSLRDEPMLSCKVLYGSICSGLHHLLLMPTLACRGLLEALLFIRGTVCGIRSPCCGHRCILGSRGCRLRHVRDQGRLQPLTSWLPSMPEAQPTKRIL